MTLATEHTQGRKMLSREGHLQAFREVVSLLTRHRQLTWEMARRELLDRHVGQTFGVLWTVIHPLFLIGLYVFVFAFVFRIRVGGTLEMPLDYTAYLLSGLIPWITFQEAMNKSCSAITGNATLVKQVVFPLEVLPAKGVLVSMFTQLISCILLVVYVLIEHGSLAPTYFLLPVLLFLQGMAMMGVGYALAALATYVRDLKDIVQLFGLAGMYLVPVFYLPQWVPGLFKPLLYANPFSYLIWCYQDALYFGRFEHPWAWLVVGVGSIVVFVLGYRSFRKLKVGFGNVL